MRGNIIKMALSSLCAMLLASCATQSTTLYYWGGTENDTSTYENLSYKDYKQQSPQAVCNLLCAYEDMVSHPGGSRKMPPPGICAEYGYLLILPTTAQYFAENATAAQKKKFPDGDYQLIFKKKGEEMFLKEVEYYPESKLFIEPLVKKLAQ